MRSTVPLRASQACLFACSVAGMQAWLKKFYVLAGGAAHQQLVPTILDVVLICKRSLCVVLLAAHLRTHPSQLVLHLAHLLNHDLVLHSRHAGGTSQSLHEEEHYSRCKLVAWEYLHAEDSVTGVLSIITMSCHNRSTAHKNVMSDNYPSGCSQEPSYVAQI